MSVIRRGAWTLPAAGLLLGAPWIKPYFAGSVTSLWIIPIVTLVGGVLMVVAGGWIALQLNRDAASRISSRDALPAAAVRT